MSAKLVVRKIVDLIDIPVFGASQFANKLSLWEGDITSLKVQCIVNDVRSDFSHPSEAVTNVINANAGHGMINDYKRMKKCPVGSALIGKGFDLPSRYVIHAASPIVSYNRVIPSLEDETLLRKCYITSLRLCINNKIRSIAFPCLATRDHRYPIKEASKTEVMSILKMLKENESEFDRVVLCTHNEKDTAVLKQTLEDCLKEFK